MRSEATLQLKPTSKEESKFIEYLALNKNNVHDVKVNKKYA